MHRSVNPFYAARVASRRNAPLRSDSYNVLDLSDQTREAIEACRARVFTIAALHQQLYQSPRVDQIDVGVYLRNLVEQLVQTYRRAWQEISPRISIDHDIHLSLDALTPCALVLHELVSNAMKHAFPEKNDGGKRHGILFVSFSQRSKNVRYSLRVEDTGVGLPIGFNLKKAKSLGLSLVYGLVEEQLNGQVEFSSNPSSGTSFTVEFFDPVTRVTRVASKDETAS